MVNHSMSNRRVRISEKHILKQEKVWIRHCLKFLKRGFVPRSFYELPEIYRTEKIRKFYRFMGNWILKNGTKYQQTIFQSRRKEKAE